MYEQIKSGPVIPTSIIYASPKFFYGNGSPEGIVPASISSTYHRLDGGAGTSCYVKESGIGKTGWAAIGASASAYVYASLNAAEDTTVTTAEIYYAITGTFTNDPFIGFIFDTDHIEYTGATTRDFEIDWHASVAADDASRTIHVGASINSAAPVGLMGMLCKTADEVYAFSGTCVVELATDDEVQLVVTSSANGDVITFKHFTTTIRAI